MTEQGGSQPVEIRDSTAFWALYRAAAWSLGGLFTVAWELGPFGLVLFAAVGGWALFRALYRPVRLEINDDGIIDRTFWFSPGFIPWTDVLDVSPSRFGCIDLELRDEAAFWERLSPLQMLARWKFPLYGLGPAAIFSWALRGSRADIVERLEERLDNFVVAEVGAGALPPGGPGGTCDSWAV
jgi:hypothetical protein